MDIDSDVEGALVNLGYKKREVKEAIASLENKTSDLETRLKEVLKKLSN
jgi:Holliday junction resolvasome RuvABC DNA-binding subunit